MTAGCDLRALYHIAKRHDWQQAQPAGVYRMSTVGKSVAEVGFIHLSLAGQVKLVAARTSNCLGYDTNSRADWCPAVQPLGRRQRQLHAAV